MLLYYRFVDAVSCVTPSVSCNLHNVSELRKRSCQMLRNRYAQCWFFDPRRFPDPGLAGWNLNHLMRGMLDDRLIARILVGPVSVLTCPPWAITARALRGWRVAKTKTTYLPAGLS